MSKMQKPKGLYVKIAVPPEMVERFKKGCVHYDMACQRKRGDVDFTVGTDNPANLYWLGANMYGEIPMSSLIKRSF